MAVPPSIFSIVKTELQLTNLLNEELWCKFFSAIYSNEDDVEIVLEGGQNICNMVCKLRKKLIQYSARHLQATLPARVKKSETS